MRQRKGNSVGDRLLMILVGLFLYAPIIILIVFSFNAGNSSSVWKGFSLHWYAELLNWYPCWLPSSPPWRAPLPLSAFTVCDAGRAPG